MSLNICSPQDAIDNEFFHPVWHGTTQEARELIKETGFKIHYGESGRNGYMNQEYYDNTPAPVHHLGYGVYFTTVLSIAKKFNNNSTRGLIPYALDISRLETINFGSEKNMMKWWMKNGYDPELARQDRVEATKILTANLMHNFDAVWFKGKGLRTLLDGDQVCVYDPDRIYLMDSSLSGGLDVGAKVVRNSDGEVGIIREKRALPRDVIDRFWDGRVDTYLLSVSWRRGAVDRNVGDLEVTPADLQQRRVIANKKLNIRKIYLRRKR